MLDKLKLIENRYIWLQNELSDPGLVSDIARYKAYSIEHAFLDPVVKLYYEYKHILESIEEYEKMLRDSQDSDYARLIREELLDLADTKSVTEDKIRIALLPKDPNDERNVFIEIRAGTGGEEAALFASDLARMYLRYAERNGYRSELISSTLTDRGGIKEAIFSLGGKSGAFSRLKYESGVHRVQRVPVTESMGKIQTSAATVAVLPDIEDIRFELKDEDLRIDTYRSSGAGGQHVNKTESAIRVTHLPTGIVVQCQDEKSQIKNKEQAMRVLRTRVYTHYEEIRNADISQKRKTMVGSGDRSERIRTYNFPQNRVTDHRIGLTLHKLDLFMDGDIDDMIDALILADQTEKLSMSEG